jgi:hypothetical protein
MLLDPLRIARICMLLLLRPWLELLRLL